MPTAASTMEALQSMPRLGWVEAPTPVTELPPLAATLDVPWVGVKRDDLCDPLHGGTKTRKLDYLLASAPFDQAQGWLGIGAIGSGQLVSLVTAAGLLGRQVRAHLFWEPLSAGVVDNLAYTASHAAELHDHGTRLSMALSSPHVLLARQVGQWAVVPPGATCAVASLGLVLAGLELGAQVAAGELPEPEVVYVALGSGGTAAGLAIGLKLAGLGCTVRAVATVERWLMSRRRLDRLIRATWTRLCDAGIVSGPLQTAPLEINRGRVGPGYGVATPESLQAVERLRAHGVALEPVYTGKAMAALLGEAGRTVRGPVLFWNTARRGLPAPIEGWRERLPPALRAKLRRAERAPDRGRRRVIIGAAALAATGAGAWRVLGYMPLTGWRGQVLSAREARILMAFAEALLPATPGGAHALSVARGADAYVAGLPASMQRDVSAAIVAVEQSALVIGSLRRGSQLAPHERVALLEKLHAGGGLLRDAARGVRDLCLLGHYGLESSWAATGFPGTTVPERPRPARAAYAGMVAPAGTLPPGTLVGRT